ncbi:hypothetical protein ABT56_16570 [Photobacterium aquae]|uniref:Uncharacterized protein n=1 Tax=Photobacterium aquae TaxID=1195763 RepID=A0A0J1JPQ8_9GAMM|nr:hypothetical protein [Photobacterium aquae]KLV04217.1 hypothetical protein ABT56_16570 [Photobacterium aquae]
MIREAVKPENGSQEGKWVGLAIVLILLFAAVALPFHQSETESVELAAHQVAISDLAQPELAMLADIRLAHEEIRNIYLDNLSEAITSEWPEVSELEEMWLAPFVKDKSWQHKGEHLWFANNDGGYLGVRQAQQGSASVILLSSGDEPEVWFSYAPVTEGRALLLAPDLRRTLQDKGWKQLSAAQSHQQHSH